MEIKVWRCHYDSVSYRIANEKERLVTLIKTMANDILEKEGFENFIGLNGSEFALGMDSQEEHIVAWGDGYFSDLIDLKIDELIDICDSLYYDSYEVVKN